MASLEAIETGVRAGQKLDVSDGLAVASDTPAMIRGASALAKALGIARSTLYEWFKLPGHPEPGADGAQDLVRWRAFAQQIGSVTEAGQSDDKSALQAKELQVIIEDRVFRLAVKKGEYTPNGEIARELTALVKEAQTVLRAKFENELPPLYTGDAAQDRTLNKAAIDEVCARLEQPLPCQQDQEGGADE